MPEAATTGPVRRQMIRQGLIIASFVLYPITFAFVSCPIITEGASKGIITGGLVVFGSIFIASLVAGRIWCGYLCPLGGLQEIYSRINNRSIRIGRLNWLKYFVSVWIFGGIAYAIYAAGGFSAADLFYGTHRGISITAPGGVVMFYAPILFITVFALLAGRRGACHYLCPIAGIAVLGRKIRNLAGWPALHLAAERNRCTDCRECPVDCPMSLDVNRMVRDGTMEQTECILCGHCIDSCPQHAITYSVSGSYLSRFSDVPTGSVKP